jgi:hypothetical protein
MNRTARSARTRKGARHEQPSFPRRGRRRLMLLAAAASTSGMALLVLGMTHSGWLAGAQVAVGGFATILAVTGVLSARRARVCARCGQAPRVRRCSLPLESADALVMAIELADPDRLARIAPPEPGEAQLELELLHCPSCRDLGWLRATSRVGGVPLRLGHTWVLLGSFLTDVLTELERRRTRLDHGA